MAIRLVVSLLAVLIVMAASPPTGVRAADPVPAASVVQSSLVIPWDIAFTPEGRMLVTERPGRIRVYASGAAGAALMSTKTVPFVRSEHESGLNGIAVDINFAANRHVYVCASRDLDGATGPEPWINEVIRYRVTSTGTLDQETVIFPKSGGAAPVANRQHNGCSVEMDAAGFLWVGVGDAADAPLAQDPESLNGKILRMTRTGDVPPDNPIIPGAGGRSVIYSMGHRNPQGIAFQPGTGRVYAAEHGPSQNDEVNWIRAGHNYGWPCYTGPGVPYQDDGTCGPASDYTGSAWASGATTIASSGLTFLDHALWGPWSGSAIMAQLKESDLRRLVPSADGTTLTQANLFLDGDYGRLRAAVQGPDGGLYVTTSNGTNDRVLRVTPGTTLVERYAGADRYATAALVSQRTYASAPVVYVATGRTYPDALTGGAAAAKSGGPVLLVTPSTVPTVTRAEIQRLAPQRIVVLGGPSAISASVLDQLSRLAPGGARRVAGADRYETAAQVARQTFPQGVPVAYVATGTDYPDALGAVPAAGLEGGPILLVRRDTPVPAPTRSALEWLRPQRIVVLGGTAAIGAGVASQLQAYTPTTIQRRAGVDRYETAVAISRASFGPSVNHVYIATGANFPDGLSGGPAAAAARGPLLLVRTDSLPASVRTELLRLNPDRVTILGGPVAVSESVRSQISAALNP